MSRPEPWTTFPKAFWSNMNELFNSDQYQKAELKTYNSVSALSSTLGIDKKVIALAKKKNLPGFRSNNTVNWGELKKPFEDSIDELLEALPDDIGTYKKEIAKRDVKIRDLQIKKLEKNLIEPEQVKELLIEIATKQSVTLKKVFAELPPKLTGLSEPEIKVIMDKALEEIFDVLKNKIDEQGT